MKKFTKGMLIAAGIFGAVGIGLTAAGGSCKPSNAKELFSNPDVDGGLIGGAALKVSDFKGIIDAFNA